MKDIYKLFGIYRITNTINGKSYIGKTGMNFGDRWDCHRAQLRGGYHDNPHLQHAWNKYGEENFEFQIVETVDDISKLNDLEMQYISEYRSNGLSYNIHDGGDGGLLLGKHLSEETKRKIGTKNREHMLGRKLSEQTKKKMSESQKKRYANMSDEERMAFGEKMKGINLGREWSKKARDAFAQRQREQPNGAKYTPDDIRDIRRKREQGYTLNQLALEYNTSPSYISTITHRRRWAYID